MKRLTFLFINLVLAFSAASAQSVIPATPQIVDYLPHSDEIGFGAIKFNLSATAADGTPLPADRMFFNLLLDDRPLVFTGDVYEDIEEEMTDVAFDYECFPKISVYGNDRIVFFYTGGFSRMGVRSVYVDTDGNRHESPTAWINADGTADGIGHTAADCGCGEKEGRWSGCDLSGRRIGSGARGIEVRRATKADGSRVWIKSFGLMR